MIEYLVCLQIKHFLCDFPLQNSYMLRKFKKFPDFIIPLALHSLVHAIGTLILCLLFCIPLWFILLDFVSHFIIDRIKANPKLLGRWKPEQSMFWNVLGLDQFLHNIIMIYMFKFMLYSR